MRITSLCQSDFEALCRLICSVYSDYSIAMHFSRMPGREELGRLFSAKMDGIAQGLVIDLVARDGADIIGECEIVRTDRSGALVGIIVDKGHTGRGVGTALMRKAESLAKGMGIRSLVAEVSSSNRRALEFLAKHGYARRRGAMGKRRRVMEHDISARL